MIEKGRIRFKTAFRRFFPVGSHLENRHLLYVCTARRVMKAVTVQGWATYIDGGVRLVLGETLARWGVVARFSIGRSNVMFGPLVTRCS